MILLIGPLHGGKRDYACALLGCGRDELGRYACWMYRSGQRDAKTLKRWLGS